MISSYFTLAIESYLFKKIRNINDFMNFYIILITILMINDEMCLRHLIAYVSLIFLNIANILVCINILYSAISAPSGHGSTMGLTMEMVFDNFSCSIISPVLKILVASLLIKA